MASFQDLENNYPLAKRPDLYDSLGGQWPTLVDHPNYQNTCAIRMSLAFVGAGLSISNTYKEAMTGDGRSLIISVKTMNKYIVDTFGQPTWGISKPAGGTVTLPVQKGIILYHADFNNATGHVDLWNGVNFVGQLDVWEGITLPSDADMTDVTYAFDVSMWFQP